MPWSTEVPLADVMVRVLKLQLRAERLALARKLKTAEAQARALGLPCDELRDARRTLIADTED